ncbi:MAG: hypothetical protein IJF58_05160 [Clostridia bacterium]|nr:hypothetical protein [Clostridia bacterium]
MTKRLTIRIVSLVLCMAMMFTCVQASATALTLEDVQQAFNRLAHYTVNELPKSLRRHLNSGWSRATLDSADAERENVLTTVDADGTKTLYSYDSPIKYVDEEGYVRFIDSSLKPCVKADGLFDWYSYENTANSVKTYFPLFIGTGVLVESEQGNIRMTPKGARLSMSSKVEEGNTEYVLYKDVFDKNTNIRYTAINEGVKEDIILEAYNGNNTFEYIVEAEGLTPVRSAGKTVEFYDGNLQTVYTLGEIVLFDSADMPATNSNNSYTVEEIDDGKYLVTLIIDEEFLTDENTVYPVVVDPEIEAIKDTEWSTQFKATTYKSDGSVSTSVNEISNNSSGATAITHLQMVDLTTFAHINPKEIEYAYLSLKFSDFNVDGMGNLYAIGHNFTTDPSTVISNLNWNSVASRCTNSSENVAQITNTTQLYITDVFKSWMTAYTKYYSRENTISAEDGLFLYSLPSSGTMNATLCSPGTSNAPMVTVRYTVDQALLPSGYYYIQSGYYYDGARYMTATSTGAELRDFNQADPNQIWYVKRVDEVYDQNVGMYYIYSVGTAKNDYLKSSGSSTIEWRNESSVPAGVGDGTCFYIVEQTEQYHRVLTAGKKAVAAKNYNKENGTPIVQEKVKGLDNQRWEFELADYGVFADGDTNISGVVGENVPFHYSIAPIDANYSIDIVNEDVAELVSYDRYHAYVKCKAVGSTDITVSFSVKSPITGRNEPYSCTWHLSVGLSLDKYTVSVDVYDSFALFATTNNDDVDVVWSSSDSSVVVSVGHGEFVAVDSGICTVRATASNDYTMYQECEVWVRGKTPVFLIHGRIDNSEKVWGVKNGIPEEQNDHFNTDEYADALNGKKYISVDSQKIVKDGIYDNSGDTDDDGTEDDEDKPRNLGKELVDAGYTENINLFAFNYPNEDAVKYSAEKFDKYIDNLIDYVKTSGSDKMKVCFFKSREDMENTSETNKLFHINIVAHSMGGLVSRYYIENLDCDENVDKLITIGTPHWGSDLAKLSNDAGVFHYICDHDLYPESCMYGGNYNTGLDCNAFFGPCYTGEYSLTSELNYSEPRHTKYYAIASVDYNATDIDLNNYTFWLPTTFSTVSEISEFFKVKNLYKIYEKDEYEMTIYAAPTMMDDNIVGFLSQIGWYDDGTEKKIIQMEEIRILVDANGGNDTLSHLHSKTPHRACTIEWVCDFLSE